MAGVGGGGGRAGIDWIALAENNGQRSYYLNALAMLGSASRGLLGATVLSQNSPTKWVSSAHLVRSVKLLVKRFFISHTKHKCVFSFTNRAFPIAAETNFFFPDRYFSCTF